MFCIPEPISEVLKKRLRLSVKDDGEMVLRLKSITKAMWVKLKEG